MLQEIVSFSNFLSRLYHLIFYKVSDQPVDMTRVRPLKRTLLLDRNHVKDHFVSFLQYFSFIPSNE